MNICARLLKIEENSRKLMYKVFRESVLKRSFGKCEKGVHIAEKCNIKGIENIYIGEGSSIGTGSILWTTRAKIIIKEKVITGPNITIITGNHRINLVGEYMADVTDTEKELSDDEDVIIKRDVWIGANVTILKGIIIEEGCVIGAGAIVTKNTEPYGIYAGVPAKRVGNRFSEKIIELHTNILCSKQNILHKGS